MAKKKSTNDSEPDNHNEHNGHVSISRVEYDAYKTLEDKITDGIIRDAKTTNRNHDLTLTCHAQARRLIEVDLIMSHHERIIGMQRVFIDMLRADHPHVAALEDLSEFWRQWTISVGDPKRSQSLTRETVAKFTPDLFRTWELWGRGVGGSFSVAGTREDNERRQPTTQAELQDDVMLQLQQKRIQLAAQMRTLEDDIETHKLNGESKSR